MADFQNQKERLKMFISSINLTNAAFEKSLGLSNGYINSMRKGLGYDKLEQISNLYTNLNMGWLLTGEGDMLINEGANENNKSNMKTESNNITGYYTTYLLPLSAMGGSLTGFEERGVTLENCEAIVSPIANVDFAITVSGDSMAPEYPSGSRILIKKINPSLFIDWGKAYVLDTPNGVILKEIWESPKEGYIRCHSINPDPKYRPFDIPMQEIYGMYRVLMSLSTK